MDKLNFAAIDIGSNAVRLLIKGITAGEKVSDLAKVFHCAGSVATGAGHLHSRAHFDRKDRETVAPHARLFATDAGL